MTADDRITELRPLWDALDEAQKAASTALAADDWQAWAEAAGRGAELHEEITRRMGWRKP